MRRRRFGPRKKLKWLLEWGRKRGISEERLRRMAKFSLWSDWFRKWRRMSFEEKVESAKKRYGIKEVSKKVKEVLWELERGKIDIEKIKGEKFVVCLPWLYELSFSKDWGVRRDVAIALGNIGVWNDIVGEMLERLSCDELGWVKEHVALALGNIKVWNDVVGRILEGLSRNRGKYWNLGECVALALGNIGVWNDVVSRILKRLSRDGHEGVKINVAKALGEIRIWNDVVGKILERLGGDKSALVRVNVADVLVGIKVWNKDVRKILEGLSKDPYSVVRKKVLEGLKKIKMDENTRRRLIENIVTTDKIVEVAGRYFSELNYEKSYLVIEGLFRKRFDMERFLKNEKYREELLDLVKAMSIERLREFVFGKRNKLF